MKALVLGGNGFIGSHLVDVLLRHGHNVRVYDRGFEYFRKPLSTVDYRIGAFNDLLTLEEALVDIDIVYHLISTTVPSSSNLDPLGDIDGNLINTVRLLQLMVSKRITRIVYLSSGGTVYGVPEILPIPEKHLLRPICSYGVVKVAIENYLFMFQSLHGIRPIVLRASNPYGERQTHTGVQGVIGTFLTKALNHEKIEIWGDGSVVRDFIYVSDLAELCVIAGDSNFVGIYNAGSGIGHSILDIIKSISIIINSAVNHEFNVGRSYDVPRVVLDIWKAQHELKWSPKIDLHDGLTRTWQWINSN